MENLPDELRERVLRLNADLLTDLLRPDEAVWLACDLLPEDGARSLWGLWWSCDNAREIGLMLQPLDAWNDALPADRDVQAIRAEMRELAQGVLVAANAKLGAGGLIDS